MATTKNRDAVWHTIDIDTLSPDMIEAYKSYKQAYAEMKRIREGFEKMIADAVQPPKGKRVVFGYNFGKLSIAVVEDEGKVAKPKAITKPSLADICRR